MNKYISLLRGINVSGHKLIKMSLLKSIYEDLKFENVKTYIQSGNVVFTSDNTNQDKIKELIEHAIKTGTGFEVDVFIIDFNAYQTIIKANPFLNKDIEIEKLYISFLSDIPDENIFDEFKSTTYNLDQLQLIGKAIYLFFPDGYSQTKLNNNFIEKKLKVKATTRNWKTSTKLLEILNETK